MNVLWHSRTSDLECDRQRRTFFFSMVLVLLFMRTPGSYAQASNANWVSGPRGEAIWQSMAQAPYAQEGDHGLVVYMITYSSCPNCILFLRDFWRPHRTDIQLREIFAPVSSQPRFLNEAADIALTRSAISADAYYHRSAVAPPTNTPERRAALVQSEKFIEQMNSLYRQLGHIQNSFPTFVLKVQDGGQDKLWIISGWGDQNLTRDMTKWVQDSSGSASTPTSASQVQAQQQAPGTASGVIGSQAFSPVTAPNLDLPGLAALRKRCMGGGGLVMLKTNDFTGITSAGLSRENIIVDGKLQPPPPGFFRGMRMANLHPGEVDRMLDIRAMTDGERDILHLLVGTSFPIFANIAFVFPKGTLGMMTEPQMEKLITPWIALPGTFRLPPHQSDSL